jgi:hypothetical protein
MKKLLIAAAGAVIAFAPVSAVSAPVAQAWPWSGCEDTVSNSTDYDACSQALFAEFDQCRHNNLGDPDPTARTNCEQAVQAKMHTLQGREGQIFEPPPQPQQGCGIFATHC